MTRDGEVKQRQHFYRHEDTICHHKSGYVKTICTERLHGDVTIMRYFQTELFSSFLPPTYFGLVNLAAVKRWLFMPNWKDGSAVEFIIFRVYNSVSA